MTDAQLTQIFDTIVLQGKPMVGWTGSRQGDKDFVENTEIQWERDNNLDAEGIAPGPWSVVN